MVNQALNNEGDDGANQIAVLIQTIFGANVHYNLLIDQVGNLADNQDAVELSGTATTIGIALNGNVLPNASQQYIFATLLHEGLHAYMDSQGFDINQHEQMATTYINTMASILMSVYPSMSRDDAYGLAWGGLEKTSAFINHDSTDPNQAYLPSNEAQINAQYRAPLQPGGKGNSCNY
jgi:hypothetical protein